MWQFGPCLVGVCFASVLFTCAGGSKTSETPDGETRRWLCSTRNMSGVCCSLHGQVLPITTEMYSNQHEPTGQFHFSSLVIDGNVANSCLTRHSAFEADTDSNMAPNPDASHHRKHGMATRQPHRLSTHRACECHVWR